MSKLILTDAAEIQLILALRGPRGGELARTGHIALVATPVAAKTWASNRERKAGLGFPCTVAGADNCGRSDLRTSETGASHDSTQPKFHFAHKVRS
jgi:hypothetical protein